MPAQVVARLSLSGWAKSRKDCRTDKEVFPVQLRKAR